MGKRNREEKSLIKQNVQVFENSNQFDKHIKEKELGDVCLRCYIILRT